MHNHIKITTKIIEQPSLRNIRNRDEWKSDNYGIEENTSILTGRRGTDMERAGLTPMWIKIQEPRPTSDPPTQDSSARKISPYNFWLQKPVGIESVEEAA